MANTNIEPATTATIADRWPGALSAWPRDEAWPQAFYACGDELLADAADGHPYVWCPELGEWDAM